MAADRAALGLPDRGERADRRHATRHRAHRGRSLALLGDEPHTILDPLTRPLRMPEVPKPGPGDLEPFLHGWSPYGPHRR
jgi:hypothetical protein